MVQNAKREAWELSIEFWKSGAVVTSFMKGEIAGLRDANGDPLPEVANRFLLDLLYYRTKPRRGRAVSKSMVRGMYRQELILEQIINKNDTTKSTPTERAIATVAKIFKMSEGSVSLIVHPRKSRST